MVVLEKDGKMSCSQKKAISWIPKNACNSQPPPHDFSNLEKLHVTQVMYIVYRASAVIQFVIHYI